MGQLSDLIAEAKVREIQRNETALAEQLAAPAAELDEGTKGHLLPFIEWATSANVRYCPALPTTVGAFILAQSAARIPEKLILATVAAIECLHDSVGLPSPCATTPARFALSKLSAIPAPRSWDKQGQLLFAGLPLEVQSIIANREADRERTLRRGQNQYAAAMKELDAQRQKQEPVSNPVEQQNEDSNHGKETRMEEGRGSVLEQ
jgi:hypothetical protein